MLVANSFDLWQKDTFFSAAEEVQRSTDIMESAYRTWQRQKIEGLQPIYLDELCRELQTALGTAKWQLEEFEKAVTQSYRKREDDIKIARHRQFVDAIESQISRVETSLQQFFNEQGKTPLRWVNLDEEESDDLAAFLSGPKEFDRKSGKVEWSNMTRTASRTEISCHVKETDVLETEEAIDSEVDKTSGSRTTWSSSHKGEWKIVIDPEEDQNDALVFNSVDTPKVKGQKPVFWRHGFRDRLEAKGAIISTQLQGIRWINQILVRAGGCQRQLLAPIPSKLSSVKFKLVLMLTLFLVVPFLIYSA